MSLALHQGSGGEAFSAWRGSAGARVCPALLPTFLRQPCAGEGWGCAMSWHVLPGRAIEKGAYELV
jgi:hypothetical protein